MGLCAALYWQESGQIAKSFREREFSRLSLFDQLLHRSFKATTDNLRILADGDGLQAFLSSGQQADLDRAVRSAVSISHQQSDYDKVRFLDQNGQEIYRVNGGGHIVPREQLQNKSDRPFFHQANALAPGEIYISAFDLNVENGQLEQPLKPTLRFTVPVFDSSGKRRGIYVINYRGSNLLAEIQQLIPAQYRQRFRLLNSKGFWIKAANPDTEWGFMLPERASQTLARSDPALWSRIAAEPDGQVRHDGGLFTWNRFSPREAVADSQGDAIVGDEFLVLGSEIAASEWNGFFTALRETFVVIGLVLLALLVMAGRFFLLKQRAIAELRKSAHEIQSTNERLREVNEELESFSYSVSHDLRAPLRHIDGFVDRLGKSPSVVADEKNKRYLSIISESARHMGNLIDDLLVFSRMGRTEMRETKVDLARMVNDVIEDMAEDTKNRNIVFNRHDLPVVQGDPVMLRQVLVNLIGNSVKYTRTRERAEIEISATETSDEYVASVRDNGVGFDMEYSHKLFGVFQRLHRSDEFEGTGIGLANVRRIIQRHRGRTWAEGKLDAGATLYFSLPKKKTNHESSETNTAGRR